MSGVWWDPEFSKLWAGQTISMVGSEVSILALPLTAVLVLRATPVQMGLLGAASTVPFLLFGLMAGVWIDRRRRRPVLIWSDLGRALLLASVPAAMAIGLRRIEVLYVVAFATGLLTLVFDVAYQAFLPALVPAARLVNGNGRLETSRASAQVLGPGLAGPLIQTVGAPMAILVDAVSYLASVAFLLGIRSNERRPDRSEFGSPVRQMSEGAGALVGNPVLRAIVIASAFFNVTTSVSIAVYLLYVSRELGLSPGVIGAIYAIGSVGTLAGAVLAAQLTRRLGVNRALVLAALVASAGMLLRPLAVPPEWLTVVLLASGQALFGFAVPNWNINQTSLRQELTPARLQGRVHASFRFLARGAMPVGMLVGGVLGSAIGLRPTLLLAAVGALLAVVTVLLSPLRMARPGAATGRGT